MAQFLPEGRVWEQRMTGLDMTIPWASENGRNGGVKKRNRSPVAPEPAQSGNFGGKGKRPASPPDVFLSYFQNDIPRGVNMGLLLTLYFSQNQQFTSKS